MLDMKQPQRMLEQLKHAAEPKPVDPALALKLASVKSSLEVSLPMNAAPMVERRQHHRLVGAGLNVLARWLSDKLVD